MNKKQIYIGLGLLAVAVVGVIIYKRSKEEKKSGFIQRNIVAKTERICWCAGPHGMVKCPCGGNSDKPK
jgi:hypothetical protein